MRRSVSQSPVKVGAAASVSLMDYVDPKPTTGLEKPDGRQPPLPQQDLVVSDGKEKLQVLVLSEEVTPAPIQEQPAVVRGRAKPKGAQPKPQKAKAAAPKAEKLKKPAMLESVIDRYSQIWTVAAYEDLARNASAFLLAGTARKLMQIMSVLINPAARFRWSPNGEVHSLKGGVLTKVGDKVVLASVGANPIKMESFEDLVNLMQLANYSNQALGLAIRNELLENFAAVMKYAVVIEFCDIKVGPQFACDADCEAMTKHEAKYTLVKDDPVTLQYVGGETYLPIGRTAYVVTAMRESKVSGAIVDRSFFKPIQMVATTSPAIAGDIVIVDDF